MALTLGKVAQRSGVGVETVRFYERSGLVPRPPRTPAGYRQYPDGTVNRMIFIRHAKELGFSLKEIKELLSLRVDRGRGCDRVRTRAEQKIAEIDERMRQLKRIRRTLDDLVEACELREPTSECPILESLDS